MANPNILNAINEIYSVEFNQPSEWLDALKLSASIAVRENDANMLNDDTDFCEMTASEYSKFKASINEEAVFHEDWTIINLERNVVRRSEKYVNAWNTIIEILMKYDIDKVSRRWLETPTDSDVLIDAFCHYDLPKAATVGGSWDLPDAYDDIPSAPSWKFSFSGFSGFIKSVSATDDPNQVKVEYCIYRRNSARGIGFYEFWDSGKAMVDISTHRRWVVK
jgi:hypothetical protein